MSFERLRNRNNENGERTIVNNSNNFGLLEELIKLAVLVERVPKRKVSFSRI